MPDLIRHLLLMLLTLATTAAGAAELRIPVPVGKPMVFTVPDEWTGQTRPTRADQPHAARVIASDPKQFTILISSFLHPDPQRPTIPPEELRARVERSLSWVRSKAVEPEPTVQDLGLTDAHGFYFFVTDKDPAPNEYKYLLQGQIAQGPVNVIFSVFMNGDPAVQAPKAVALLRSFRRE